MKKILVTLFALAVVTQIYAETKTAYLDLYQRGGGQNLITTILYSNNPLCLGRKNLGEMLNVLSNLGWEIAAAPGTTTIKNGFGITRHKFHIILKKEYNDNECPFVELDNYLVKQPSSNITFNNNSLAISKVPVFGKRLYGVTSKRIMYRVTKGQYISTGTMKNLPAFVKDHGPGTVRVLSFSDDVRIIPDNAFIDCVHMSSIALPESVEGIGANAFKGCDALTTICCKAVIPPTLLDNSLFGISSSAKIYVPSASVNAYKTAQYWSAYASQIVGYKF